jgi:hypothetical protein
VSGDDGASGSAGRLRLAALLAHWVPVLVFANERAAPPPSEQPEVTLHHWRIVLVSGAGTRELRLVGYLAPEGPTVRITTPVVQLEASSRLACTQSGRRYLLTGPPCEDGERHLVLAARIALEGLHVEEDLSKEFWL